MHNLEFVIHELLPGTESVGVSMRRLIHAHAQVYPDGDWSMYYDIPYDREIPYLQRDWFPSVIANDPPANVPVAGFWFGLFNPEIGERRQRTTTTDFYVAGARQFKLDASADWAVGPEYFPEGRYAESGVLSAIHRAAYGPRGLRGGEPDGLGNDAEQYLCLGYVAFALKFILSDFDLRLVLGNQGKVGIAVGWDSSSFPLYVGTLTRDGFRVRDPKEAIAGIEKRQAEFDEWFRERYGK